MQHLSIRSVALSAAAIVGVCGLALAGHDVDCTPGLSNRSFEIDGFFPQIFADWEDFGGNISRSPDIDGEAVPLTGTSTCKIFGQFSGFPNATILRQGLTAAPGELLEARIHSWQNSADLIGPNSVGFASVEFFDAGRVTQLQITNLDTARPGGPTDIWEEWTISAVAPANAAEAILTLGYFQGGTPPFEGGAVFYEDVSLCNLGAFDGLVNADFNSYVPNAEFAADVCCVPGWTRPGAANAVLTPEFARSDNHALAMFGEGTGLENTVVVYQDLDLGLITTAAVGDLVEGSAWSGHTASSTGGLVQGGNFAFLALQFLDGSDTLLEVTRARLVDSTSTPDEFVQGVATATVPSGAAKARLLLGFFQEAGDPGPPVVQPEGAAFLDDAAMTSLGPNAGLVNAGFDTFRAGLDGEPDPNQYIPGWPASVAPTAPNFGQTTPASSGEFAAFLFGQFPGDGSANDTVLFQEFDVAPGDGVEVDAMVLHSTSDPLAPGNVLSLTVDFLDGVGSVLSTSAVTALDSTSPQSVYIPASVSGTAPTGTATGRINFVFTQVNEGTGAALFDEVSLAITPAPPCVGDIDGDGDTDIFDFGIFGPAFGTSVGDPGYVAAADLNNDGTIDIFDFGIFGPDFGCPN